MNRKIEFNIISATIDSTAQVLNFIKHIKNAHQSHSNCIKLNLIIVDQFTSNREYIFLQELPSLTYIHSNQKGLSLNRNIGINQLKSNIYTFLDSDCEIDSTYFENFLSSFEEKNNNCMIYGSIKSTENKNINVFKKWPIQSKKFNIFEKWIYSTSVNIIYIGKPIYFDEHLGLGTYFGSCEDIDYALRFDKESFFNSNLHIYHPSQTFEDINTQKVISYSRGYGALCRKHFSPTSIFFFISSIFYKLIKIKQKNINKSLLSIKGRFQGFVKFKK